MGLINSHSVENGALPMSESQFQAAKNELAVARQQDPWLIPELRSDHAGETGAVWIYKGAQDAMKLRSMPPGVATFCQHHLATEKGHLAFFEAALRPEEKSAIVPVWRVAGWLLGFMPTLCGAKALYGTIHAVETYVEEHYNNHIDPLKSLPAERQYPVLTKALTHFCSDEVDHAKDAGDRYGFQALEAHRQSATLLRAWGAVVAWGSAVAVSVAKIV